MPGRILIVDGVATNRIVLKVKLSAAQYDIVQCHNCHDARQEVSNQVPDVVVLDLGLGDGDSLQFCQDLRKDPRTANIPVIATASRGNTEEKLEALRAGADEVLMKPLHDSLLLARVRSLLRSRDAAAELRMREDTQHALGFAEQSPRFVAPSRVTLVADTREVARIWQYSLKKCPDMHVNIVEREDVLRGVQHAKPTDVFVIDTQNEDAHSTLRLLSELRSRVDTRLAAIILIVPDDDPELSAMALDLGANDLLSVGFSLRELALRVQVQTRRKAVQDQLREGLRDGLQAAVTDPLTGLYNRRYAVPHLRRIAQNAAKSGKGFAVMMLDIDHFKTINDRFGHAAGDQVLIEVSERLTSNLRAIDFVARFGGEEFLVAMPETSSERALMTANRLCEEIGAAPFHVPGIDLPIQVTLSIGVAMSADDSLSGDACNVLFGRADDALYAAKNAGRNTVTMNQSAA